MVTSYPLMPGASIPWQIGALALSSQRVSFVSHLPRPSKLGSYHESLSFVSLEGIDILKQRNRHKCNPRLFNVHAESVVSLQKVSPTTIQCAKQAQTVVGKLNKRGSNLYRHPACIKSTVAIHPGARIYKFACNLQ